MRRSFFADAVLGRPFAVRPITLAVYSYDIPKDELGDVLKRAAPPGYTGTSPQVIKTLDGEFLVYGDGSAQFVPLGRAPGERFQLSGARLGELICCTPPGQQGGPSPCFDTNYQGTGTCAVAWMDQSNATHPTCVEGTEGQPYQGKWLPPSCARAPEPPTPTPPPPPTEPVTPGTDECPEGWTPAEAVGELRCCRTREEGPDADGKCWKVTECIRAADPDTILGPVTEEIPCPEAPTYPPKACRTNGLYDLYDADTGEVLARDVAEGDLPDDVEVLAPDDPRCADLTVSPAPPTPAGVSPPPLGPAGPLPVRERMPRGTLTQPCGFQRPYQVQVLRRWTHEQRGPQDFDPRFGWVR